MLYIQNLSRKMKNKFFLILVWTICFYANTEVIAQKDSLNTTVELGIRGRWQTGNLNQFGANPSLRMVFSKPTFNTEIQSNYQYLKVNGFVAVSDLWTNGIYRFQPEKKFFPMATSVFGFAKSYKIEHSIMAGAGVGLNVFRKSIGNYFQIHVFGGYLNLEFENGPTASTPSLGAFIKSSFSIIQQLRINWELQTYNPLIDTEFWGANNLLLLHFQVSKVLFLNISHQTIFNNKTISDIKKVNTLMMFGVQLRFSKHQNIIMDK